MTREELLLASLRLQELHEDGVTLRFGYDGGQILPTATRPERISMSDLEQLEDLFTSCWSEDAPRH
jgi:hypothetical protein